MAWEKATSIEELARGAVLHRHPPRQIAVFLVGERVYAVDNRCPHEGYPLVKGHVDDEGCVLTCNWHNWKFRLGDGQCVLGGDDVRAYPVEVRDEEVWVNLEDPPIEAVRRKILDGLRIAFEKRDFGRICRELTRLHYEGLDPLLGLYEAMRWSHDRFEYGTTHAYAAGADWIRLFHAYAGDWEKQLVCLAEAVDHMAFDSLRHRSFPFPAADIVDGAFDRASFVAAVEAEDRDTAAALVQRGLDDGRHWRDMEEAFVEAALLHYNDFGHSLIFVYKTAQLLERLEVDVEPDVEAWLLLPLARHLCYATREDLVPEFATYAPTLTRLAELSKSESESAPLEVPYPVPMRDAFRWLETHASTRRAHSLFDALLEALCRNLLHYDMGYDRAFDKPVAKSVGWLHLTHGVTFANAARNLCEKYPRLWRPALLQMACFVGRNRPFLDMDLEERAWFVDDREGFLEASHQKILDHGLRDPIFSAHVLKTTVAVEEELRAASPSCQRYLLAGLNRFLNSPIKQKHTRRLARQAIGLVRRDFE